MSMRYEIQALSTDFQLSFHKFLSGLTKFKLFFICRVLNYLEFPVALFFIFGNITTDSGAVAHIVRGGAEYWLVHEVEPSTG